MNLYSRMLATGGLAALAGLGALPAHGQAQAYPTRAITMIVPFAAGGPTDVDRAHRHRAYGADARPEHHHRERGRRRRHHRHHPRGARRQ